MSLDPDTAFDALPGRPGQARTFQETWDDMLRWARENPDSEQAKNPAFLAQCLAWNLLHDGWLGAVLRGLELDRAEVMRAVLDEPV